MKKFRLPRELKNKPLSVRKFNLKTEDSRRVDYVVIVEEFTNSVNRTTMYRSADPEWTNPNELLFEMVDDGNRMRFECKNTDKKTNFEYHEIGELFLFLRTHHSVHPIYMGSFAEEINEQKI